jgi:hypothetical protein
MRAFGCGSRVCDAALHAASRPGHQKGNCCRFSTSGKTLPLFRSCAFCPAPSAKIFLFPKLGTYDLTKPSRPQEGRCASSPVSARDAVDAACRQTCGRSRTVKPCGPDPPTLGSSFAEMIGEATGANKPGTPGRARSSRKEPSRRECRSDYGVPVLACVRRFRSARKAMGAACTRHSLHPLPFEGDCWQSPDISCRGNADARHCKERSPGERSDTRVVTDPHVASLMRATAGFE